MKIVIAGMPKSGTTALFYKIKHSLPPETVCLFEPSRFDGARKAGHADILAKVLVSPWLDIGSFSEFDRKIHIVRDPRDSFISLLLYVVRDSEIPQSPQKAAALLNLLARKEEGVSQVTVCEIAEMIESLSPRTAPVRFWLDELRLDADFGTHHTDYFAVKYEDFIDDRLVGLEQYLGFSLPGTAVVGKRHKRVERTKSYGDWKNWFEEEDVAYFRPLMQDYMLQYEFGDDWELNSTGSVSPQYGSQYVAKIVNEAASRNRAQRILGQLRHWKNARSNR